MGLDGFFKALGPFIATAVASGAAGCKDSKFATDAKKGVPLSELDLTEAAPAGVTLAGSDSVRISVGESLEIALDGEDDATSHMRFALDGDTLHILRKPDSWGARSKALVKITMPAPAKLVIAGSGCIETDALAKKAEITIAGSGDVTARSLDVDSLSVRLAGSGNCTASGKAGKLRLSIAGSGNGALEGLEAGSAKLSIAGSGNAGFTSDGDVTARIMGSGHVTVFGDASCTVKSFGSGSVTCKRRGAA